MTRPASLGVSHASLGHQAPAANAVPIGDAMRSKDPTHAAPFQRTCTLPSIGSILGDRILNNDSMHSSEQCRRNSAASDHSTHEALALSYHTPKHTTHPSEFIEKDVKDAALALLGHGAQIHKGSEMLPRASKKRASLVYLSSQDTSDDGGPNKRLLRDSTGDILGATCSWPDCEAQCPHSSNTPYRKVVSDCFGRNVSALRGDVPWIYVCRRRYQRQKYAGPQSANELRAIMLVMQLELWKQWGGFTTFLVQYPAHMSGAKHLDELLAFAKDTYVKVMEKSAPFPKVRAFPKMDAVLETPVTHDDAATLLSLSLWKPMDHPELAPKPLRSEARALPVGGSANSDAGNGAESSIGMVHCKGNFLETLMGNSTSTGSSSSSSSRSQSERQVEYQFINYQWPLKDNIKGILA